MATPLSEERIAEMREFWDGHEDGDTSDDRAVWRFVHHASLALLDELDRLHEEKDRAYGERDRLVAALSKVFPSHLCRHPDEDTEWETDWRWIVCIHLPTGQATWHIHDSERHQFNHLSVSANHWDGHTTEEKYRRLDSLPESGAEVDRLRARVALLEGVLREVEWIYFNGILADECYICGACKGGGHAPDCALDAALRDAHEGERNG